MTAAVVTAWPVLVLYIHLEDIRSWVRERQRNAWHARGRLHPWNRVQGAPAPAPARRSFFFAPHDTHATILVRCDRPATSAQETKIDERVGSIASKMAKVVIALQAEPRRPRLLPIIHATHGFSRMSSDLTNHSAASKHV